MGGSAEGGLKSILEPKMELSNRCGCRVMGKNVSDF